jgi:hypothetical protein
VIGYDGCEKRSVFSKERRLLYLKVSPLQLSHKGQLSLIISSATETIRNRLVAHASGLIVGSRRHNSPMVA